MKVLFAVSNEEISESVVKKYQKEYKQIISYKNVYYFNAILKEIQKDKSYDRIVISEDLEAFTNTQYDQIDKFIFEKLDSISDEASNSRGNDIPIILICSDRRTKSEEILVKLFGIGIYNAVIGSDRSIDEVCKLINRPRSKKEAKIYYKIDSEDVNYQAENENDVSEMEIQNILAHYKRLGKNEDRYIDSFNNIAAQYNDTQLRIISKFLPLNVRAVLEEKSPKYQQIMSFNNSVSNTLRVKENKEEGTSETLLTPKNIERIMSKPVVIPSSVNMKGTRKLARQKPEEEQIETEESKELESIQEKRIIPEQKEEIVEEVVQTPVKRGRGRPRKNPIPVATENTQVKRRRGRPRKNPLPEVIEEEAAKLPEIQEDEETVTLPGFEDEVINENVSVDSDNNFLPGFEEVDNLNTEESSVLPGLEEPESTETFNEYNSISQNSYIPSQNTFENNYQNETTYSPRVTVESNYEGTVDLERLLTPDKKIVTFVGTSKNGTSFLVNNVAEILAMNNVKTAILDLTQNRNAYYIYTKNEEDLRVKANDCIKKLKNGIANGVEVHKNLTVYTSAFDVDEIENVEPIVETLLKEHDIILLDCDFNTPDRYFKYSQEIYIVQSMDILTIQPLTLFLRKLSDKGYLEESKIRVVLNKYIRTKELNEYILVGGISIYNDAGMTVRKELFNRRTVKRITIPFEVETYLRYLNGLVICDVSLKGYSKKLLQSLKQLATLVYSNSNSGQSGKYVPPSAKNSTFSPSMNSTLEQMSKRY